MTPGLVSARYPGRPALLTEGGFSLDYAQLHEAIARRADALPGRELMFIVGGNDLPTVLCYLAALRRGTVPLLLGSGIGEQALQALLHSYDPSLVFAPVGHPGLDEAEHLSRDGNYALHRRTQAVPCELHDDLALLLATSGSTGSAKLVRLSNANLHANASSIVRYLKIDKYERAITTLPFNYSYGLSVINSHLHAGASVVLCDHSLLSPEFWKLLGETEATSFAGVPYSYEMLLKLRFARLAMPSIRTLTQAGGRLDADKQRLVQQACREKGIRFVPMYGQTEATARIAWLSPDLLDTKAGSIGRAIPGGQLWLEDQAGQKIADTGEVGELVYAGPNVSLGYAECRADLALGDVNAGVLHTGDLARVDSDGCYYIEGRLRRFLKLFGVRVSLDAVEALLATRGLAAAAHGHDDNLVVHVTGVNEEQRIHLRQSLATTLGVHASAIDVQPLDVLPRLPSGKVDYPSLQALCPEAVS